MKAQTAIEIKERPILFSGPMVRAILDGRKTKTRRVVDWKVRESGLNLGFSGLEVGFYSAWDSESGWVLRSRDGHGCWNDRTFPIHCPYGKPGHRLWVRESFYVDHIDYGDGQRLGSTRPDGVTDDMLYYPADARQDKPNWCCQLIPECCCHEIGKAKARSARFIPRWASRITLEITNVRVERLRDISEEHAQAEGVQIPVTPDGTWLRCISSKYVPKAPTFREHFIMLWEEINGKKYPWESNPWIWVVEFKKV